MSLSCLPYESDSINLVGLSSPPYKYKLVIFSLFSSDTVNSDIVLLSIINFEYFFSAISCCGCGQLNLILAGQELHY